MKKIIGINMKYTSQIKNIDRVKNACVIMQNICLNKESVKVYVELEENVDFIEIRKQILNMDIFKYHEVDIELVDDVNKFSTLSLEYEYRYTGNSSFQTNQNICFNLNINMASLVGEILVKGAKICLRQEAGIYSLLDIPLRDFN